MLTSLLHMVAHVVLLLHVEPLLLDGTMVLMQLLPLVGVVVMMVVMLPLLLVVLLVLLRYGLMRVGGRLLVFVGKGMHLVVRLLVLLPMLVGL
jgi:hypothetical protein